VRQAALATSPLVRVHNLEAMERTPLSKQGNRVCVRQRRRLEYPPVTLNLFQDPPAVPHRPCGGMVEAETSSA
jgi:hypothetical protein